MKRKNMNRVNDMRSPYYWEDLCSIENSQFCGFSEEGNISGIPVCNECPYLKENGYTINNN